MNIQHANVVLRERRLLEVFDLAIRFVSALDGLAYLKLWSVLLLPAFAIALLARHVGGWHWAAVWLLALASGSALQGAFTILAGQLMFSERVASRETLRRYGRRLPSYLAALALSRGLLGLSLSLPILLPFAWSRLLYVHEAVLLEEAKAREALRRSSRFVAHQATNALPTLIALVITVLLCVALAELLGQALVGFVLQLGQPLGSVLDGGSPYALFGYFASVPLTATARFLSYIDSRTRSDGWDIQVRFVAIEAAERERLA